MTNRTISFVLTGTFFAYIIATIVSFAIGLHVLITIYLAISAILSVVYAAKLDSAATRAEIDLYGDIDH